MKFTPNPEEPPMTYQDIFPAPFSIGTQVRIQGRVEFHVADGIGHGYEAAISEGTRATIVGTGPDGMLFVETAAYAFVKVPPHVPVEAI
jgi:hypothetical protein